MKISAQTTIAVRLFVCLSMLVWPYQVPGQTTAVPSPSRPPSKQPADTAKIERLIRQLGSERFAKREAASKALASIGEPAWRAVLNAQSDPDPEIRRRAADLVKILARQRAPMRAKAWAAFRRLGFRINNSDTGIPAEEIADIELFLADRLRNDNDLAWLQWLDDTSCLSLVNARITDAGLVHLKKCFRLKILTIGTTEITDAGLEHIGNIKTLACLYIDYSKVTDAGLVHLKKLDRLTALNLAGLPVTEVGLEHIKDLKRLNWLNLSNTKITDAGLAKLKELKKLEWLELSGTPITDAGLTHLKEIRTLEWLNVNETKVTERGKADLQKSLPKLGIVKP